MFHIRKATLAVHVSIFFLFSPLLTTGARAQFVEIAHEFYDALNTVADLANKAMEAQTDLNFIERERKEPPRTWPWQEAVKRFTATAQEIENAHFAVTFKDGDFPLPKGDWSLCVNRAVLLKTVDSEVDSFDRGLSTLHDLSAKLVAAQDEVNSTQKSLVDIQKIYLRLAHISELNPLLHHYFQETDALDISLKVEPALGKVRKAIRDRQKRVDSGVAAVTNARWPAPGLVDTRLS